MNTSFSNNIRDGHRGNTEIDLGDRRVLTVSTRKLNSSLVTSASVSLVEGGFKRFVMGFGGDGDFSKKLVASKPKRVTEKVVREQHTQALTQIEDLKLQVEMHYDALEKRKAAAHA